MDATNPKIIPEPRKAILTMHTFLFQLSLDYKSQRIVGLNGHTLTGFMISFYFERKGINWVDVKKSWQHFSFYF